MITFIGSLLLFIKRSIHYRIMNRGLGDFAPEAIVVPLNPRPHIVFPAAAHREINTHP